MLSTRWSAVIAAAMLMLCLPALVMAEWKKGDALPDLKSFSLSGDLPDLSGKVVLVDFWASWCAPCKASFPAMSKLQDDFRDQGLVILAVSVDEEAKDMDKFLKKNPVTFSVVRDAQQKLVADASVKTMPTSFLVGRDGRIIAIHSGYQGDSTAQMYRAEIQKALAGSKP